MSRPPTAPPRPTIVLRSPKRSDGAALWSLARASGLDENSPYAYLLWTEYFADTTVVGVDDDDAPVAFVTGFRRPDETDTVFVWQIGVADSHRRRGIAASLLDTLVSSTGATTVEATVTADNTASDTLFRRFAERHGATVETDEVFPAELFPGAPSGPAPSGHDAEIRYRIGPIAS